MKCNRQLLSEYLDGELSAEQKRQLEGHLAWCAECTEVLGEYRRMSGVIRGLPTQPVPAMLEAGLVARLSEADSRTWWRKLLRPAVELSVMAVTAILTVMVVGGALQGFDFNSAPAVTAATPWSGSTDVPTDTRIRVIFDRAMDRASVEKSVMLDPPVPVDYLWQDDDLLVVPREPLRPGATYRVVVDQSAKDGQGRPVQAAFSMEFTTARDGEPTSPGETEPPLMAANQTPSTLPRPQVGVMESPSVSSSQAQPQGTVDPDRTAELQPSDVSNPPAEAATAQAAAPTVTPAEPTVTPPAVKGTPTPMATATPSSAPSAETTMVAVGQGTPITATPLVSPEPTVEVVRGFGLIYWNNDQVRERLGPPIEAERGILAAEQPFQGGCMLWNANDKIVYVLNSDGTWCAYDDDWTQSEPESLNLVVPPDLYEPTRGFGKVWRENVGVRQALGWGVSLESGYIGVFQRFNGGEMFWSNQRLTYVLYYEGTWECHPDPVSEE